MLIWNLADSKTSLEELRAHLPAIEPPSAWISNEAGERFGLIAYGDEFPDVSEIRALIGTDPVAGEEFDLEPRG